MGLGPLGAFVAVFSIMVVYFAAVVINFGDFARFVKSEDEIKKGQSVGIGRKYCDLLLYHLDDNWRHDCHLWGIYCRANADGGKGG